ncbi:MAG: phytanoyl-CoA dioxygenase family protein, partial [Actinomycetota bacterium]
MGTSTATVDDHLARVDADGFTILEGVIEPDLVAAVRDAIRRIEIDLDVQPKGTQAEGIATKRMYNLLVKDPVFAALPVHPAVLPIAEGMLDRGLLLSGMTAMDIGPGERAQPLHGDDAVMSRHLPRPHPPMVVTTLWAFTDFTAANGATRFVRGSHRFAATPDQPGAFAGHEIECFEAPAGSV